MGFRLESDKVREMAFELIRETTPWEFGDKDDISYLKQCMYNQGVLEMTEIVINAIEELKKA